MESTPNKSKDPSPWEAAAVAGDFIITILVLTTVFALGGRWLDTKFHTSFLFTVIGFVLLILIGYRVLIRKAEKMKKKLGLDNQDDTSQKPKTDG